MPFGLSRQNKNEVDFKSRLERKLYLARENPEPIFDISECNLKVVPAGVYALCKVFRKEALYLGDNLLTCLSGGGNLQDLQLLKVLDLHANKLTKLPNEIRCLTQLEVLNVSQNELSALPECIGNLKCLTSLIVSSNKLQNIPQTIGDCALLQVIDVQNNKHLKRLPNTMGHLKYLSELCVSDTLEYPPLHVFTQGTSAAVSYLRADGCPTVDSSAISDRDVQCEKAVVNHSQYDALQEKLKLLEKAKEERRRERINLEQNLTNATQMELMAQEAARCNKSRLVEDLLNQQRCLEAEISKVQADKDAGRVLLLQQCSQAEERAHDVVDQLVNNNRTSKDRVLWLTEQTRLEDQLLHNLTTTSKALEKTAILHSMEELMKKEMMKAEQLEQSRIHATQSIMSQESIMSHKLASLAKKSGTEQKELMESILRNEDLQKTAVASLLEKSDARSWQLTQQVAVVESKLAELSRLEMKRRQLETDERIVDLCSSRTALTNLLMELFEEQAKRRSELVASLQRMEGMRADAADTFWLEQYQRLMQSKSLSLVDTLRTVDPALASELIVAGVLHCLPLIAPLLSSDKAVHYLSDDQLSKAGVSCADDRHLILKAVSSYLKSKDLWSGVPCPPSAPEDTEASAPVLSPTASYDASQLHLVSDDCVVCLDALCDVIFLPCGHVCCCSKCGCTLTQCPLCRGAVTQIVSSAAPP